MSSEVKTILRDRLKQNYEAYIAGLQGKSASELIDLASEITAAKQVCEELPDACDEDATVFLLSAPVIKCKKTPRKKCRFVAEVRKKR